MVQEDKFGFAIDRGGTFTDVYAECPGGKVRVMKLLSVDPSNYEDAPREGIRRILEQVSAASLSSKDKPKFRCKVLKLCTQLDYESTERNQWPTRMDVERNFQTFHIFRHVRYDVPSLTIHGTRFFTQNNIRQH